MPGILVHLRYFCDICKRYSCRPYYTNRGNKRLKTKDMTLQQLEYILALNRLGNFAKAADYCDVTQPTLPTPTAHRHHQSRAGRHPASQRGTLSVQTPQRDRRGREGYLSRYFHHRRASDHCTLSYPPFLPTVDEGASRNGSAHRRVENQGHETGLAQW